MKIDREQFDINCDKIDAIFTNMTSNGTTVTDGVIDRDAYLNAKVRLMWVLKEANSEDSWSYISNFKNIEWLNRCNGLSSIRRVIYTSYGILKSGDIPWSDFPWSNEIECQSALREIAFINLKKMPGGSVANSQEIEDAYKANRELLRLQIDTYKPDVIIFGNTMNLVDKSDFEGLVTAEKRVSDFNNHYYYSDNRLYIHAYHPSYTRMTDKNYVMDIVEIYREWRKSNNI